MITSTATITSPHGMHARPAGGLAKLAKSFAPTKVTLSDGVKTKDAASIMSVMSMGLKCGTTVTISADGPDEAAALKAVKTFMESITD